MTAAILPFPQPVTSWECRVAADAVQNALAVLRSPAYLPPDTLRHQCDVIEAWSPEPMDVALAQAIRRNLDRQEREPDSHPPIVALMALAILAGGALGAATVIWPGVLL